ncbi:uncharacterized protein FIBRA_06440 [Fibroporia radiculosa]|uniref:2,4-dienoyl-CoA reductase [(3E)-enoyl-CoA-producing] n=1 Tax=Fibroporia radiculosa TaxID=599839 RepID=J4GSR2_9APHY|nr:uncharacterized protein FIBRA_06440 [Fibroporia radiculosa]CCM04270.1 predicted protein [Fibroporia radiculosa]
MAYVSPVAHSTSIFKDDLFKGKVLFCTGGGSGICKAMTETMMRHGADACIVGRKLDRLNASAGELAKATGKRCIAAQGDVRNPEQLKSAVAKTMEAFGRIDFVICGESLLFVPVVGCLNLREQTVVDIDTIGTYNTIKATIAYVRASKGSYIHVSATLHYKATPFQVHVSAAKAAVDATSAVLAVEEGPHGVRSNVIAPGPIGGTEGVDRLQTKDKLNGGISSRIPLGRLGHLNDIANTTVFLFSDAASFITGQVIAVDGGSEPLRTVGLPYPQCVLDPASVKDMIKPRL